MKKIFYSGKKSFTVVELLVGMAIFGIITAGIYAAFSNAIRFNRRARRADTLYRDSRWTLDAIHFDLENAVSYQTLRETSQVSTVRVTEATRGNVNITQRMMAELDDATARKKGAFIGEENSLSLVLTSPEGFREIRYYLESPRDAGVFHLLVGRPAGAPLREEESYFLIRESRPFPAREIGRQDERCEKEVLTRNVCKDGLTFSYAGYDAASPEAAVVWTETWAQAPLPLAVGVEIVFCSPGDDQTWRVSRKMIIPRGQRVSSADQQEGPGR